jgi:hypothetical protein
MQYPIRPLLTPVVAQCEFVYRRNYLITEATSIARWRYGKYATAMLSEQAGASQLLSRDHVATPTDTKETIENSVFYVIRACAK